MKIKSTCILLFVLILFAARRTEAQQQTVLLNENFDGWQYNIYGGWLNDFSGPVPWESQQPAYIGRYYGFMNPENKNGPNRIAFISDCGLGDFNDSNVLLASPYLDFTNTPGLWLQYDSYFYKDTSNGFVESGTVQITTDSGATWSNVQSVPALRDTSQYKTWHINLSQYYNNATHKVRIGWRYRDGGGACMPGWAIDNAKVYVPFHKDLQMVSIDESDSFTSYVQQNQPISLSGAVYNAGLDTATAFLIQYQYGSGPVFTDTVSNVVLPQFTFLKFRHPIPYSPPGIGNYRLKMWVKLAGEQYPANDTLPVIIRGTSFMPQKLLTIESGTGTWDSACPRQIVYMDALEHSDYPASLISAHDDDPMSIPAYTEFLFLTRYNYTPYFLFDRRMSVDATTLITQPGVLFSQFDKQRSYFGFADISLDPTYYSGGLTIRATVKPAIDLQGDYRLALVLTEYGVTGSGAGYDQQNGFANNARGPMGGFENLPDPVPAAQMHYDRVARTITPDPGGKAGCLPMSMLHDQSYSCLLSANLDPSWNRGKMKAIVLLIRAGDSSIVNSQQLHIPGLGITGISAADNVRLYPNPATNNVTLSLELPAADNVKIEVTDITGRSIVSQQQQSLHAGAHQYNYSTQSWPAGIYLVTLQTGRGRQTLKLDVVH